jgi:hypothetical protein
MNQTVQNVSESSFSLPGQPWNILLYNDQCLLLDDTNGTIDLYRFSSTNSSYTLEADLQSLISSYSPYTKLSISDNCDRLQIDSHYFYQVGQGNYTQVGLNGVTVSATADANITTVLAANGSVFRVNATTNGLDFWDALGGTKDSNFSADSQVHTFGNRIVVMGQNSTHAWVYARRQLPAPSQSLLSFELSGLQNTNAQLQVSPNLTKLLLVTQTAAGANRIDGFHINYTEGSSQNINFP